MKNIKFEYDQEVDAAYIYIKYPIKDKEAARTIELNDNIRIDFDKKNKILGFEILDASKIMNKEVLLEVQSAS